MTEQPNTRHAAREELRAELMDRWRSSHLNHWRLDSVVRAEVLQGLKDYTWFLRFDVASGTAATLEEAQAAAVEAIVDALLPVEREAEG